MISDEVRTLEAENEILKETIDRLLADFEEKEKLSRTCGLCEYFLQHYVYVHKRFIATGYGHCIHNRCKDRETKTKSCQYFKLSSDGGSR